eukprot:4651858-Alexandrium_andersonii.AAC.1
MRETPNLRHHAGVGYEVVPTPCHRRVVCNACALPILPTPSPCPCTNVVPPPFRDGSAQHWELRRSTVQIGADD